MRQIDYVNAPAGAGKTFAATGWIKEPIAQGEKFVLVQPITRLIAETVDQTFPDQSIDPSLVTEITERTHPNGGIVKAIIEHINVAPDDRGEVLVITHAAFLKRGLVQPRAGKTTTFCPTF